MAESAAEKTGWIDAFAKISGIKIGLFYCLKYLLKAYSFFF